MTRRWYHKQPGVELCLITVSSSLSSYLRCGDGGIPSYLTQPILDLADSPKCLKADICSCAVDLWTTWRIQCCYLFVFLNYYPELGICGKLGCPCPCWLTFRDGMRGESPSSATISQDQRPRSINNDPRCYIVRNTWYICHTSRVGPKSIVINSESRQGVQRKRGRELILQRLTVT